MCKTIYQAYGCRARYSPRKYMISIKSSRAVKDLLSYSDVGCYVWRVPREIAEAASNIQKAYIQAFADAEATVDTTSRYRIRISSRNQAGLTQIQSMLNTTFHIPSTLRGPYAYGVITLKFLVKNGFSHSKKK
jgi:hypothetical protein